jgi:hypothetical protein
MSPRKDNIRAELIKYGEGKLWEEIHAMIEDLSAKKNKSQRIGELQLCAPYTRSERNCNVAVID